MEVIKINDNWPKLENITLTIGNFDGVHLGHQQLIKKTLSFTDTKSAVMTLDPHPNQVFRDKNYKTLLTENQKTIIFNKFNVDYLIYASFNENFYSLTIKEFINKLKYLGVKRLVLGSDFRFATKGSGSVKDLQKEFEVFIFHDIKYEDERISSTIIRENLEKGNISKSNSMLGYNYLINGFVEHGNKVGKTLGFPTANINYADSLLPKKGVYFVKMYFDNTSYFGMASIGNNPTINYSETKKLEIFILDYDNIIYNKDVIVEFIERIRDEIKFNSKEDLINEIHNDEKIIRNLINNIKI